MDTLKKIIGTIFAILFILTAVFALILFNFDRKGFTAATYQKAFARDDFYNRLPAVMAEAVATGNTGPGQFPIAGGGMSQAAWEAFFRTLLPPETLQVMGDDILSSTFNYLNMKTDSVQLSLTPLKLSIVTDTGVQAVFSLLKTQPDCTLLQVGQMTVDMLTQSQIQFCNPPEAMIPLLTPVVQGQLQFTAAAIPDTFTLVSAPAENDPRDRLQTLRLIMRLSPILPLAFLLLMTLFTVKSLKSWLNWWGVPFFITGGLASLMSWSGAPIFGRLFERILVNRMPAYLPAILLDYASDLAAAMLNALLRPVLWQGIALTLIGLLMASSSFFIGRNTTPKITSPSEANTIV
ncbi:MAG: hypothetical protein K8S20_09575 [Chloroflexi bacterium]|nr:hypothetical protein [Chloroflexota bacterium]